MKPFKLILGATIGGAIEAYDLFIFSYFSIYIAHTFFKNTVLNTALMGTYFIFFLSVIVRPLGGLIFGFIGDVYGRKKAFSLSIWMMTIATLIIAILPGYQTFGSLSVVLLVVIKIIQSISISGEYMGGVIYLSESSEKHHPGFLGSLAIFGSNFGVLFASIICWLTSTICSSEALYSWAWRFPFVLSLLGCLAGIILSKLPDESANKAKSKDPIRIFTWVEKILEHRSLCLQTILFVSLGAVITYLLFGYMTTLLVTQQGFSMSHALMLNNIALMVLVLTVPISGCFSDKIGLTKVMQFATVGICIAIYPYFYALSTNNTIAIILSQCLLAVFVGCYFSVTPTIIAHMIPKHIRYTVSSLNYNIAVGIFGGMTPIVATKLINYTGNMFILAHYLFLMGALVLLVSRMNQMETQFYQA